MNYSSKRLPCPVCQRCKDSKCRWSNTRIYCYIGDSFSPPLSLRIGEKIKIAGEYWRLFSHASGFSQNSYAFALDEGESYRFLPYEDKKLFRGNCIKLTRIFLQKEKAVDASLAGLIDESHFQLMGVDDFYSNKLLALKVRADLFDLIDFSFTNKRYLMGSGVDVNRPKELFKKIQRDLETVYDFERQYLGNTRPETGDLRGKQFIF